MVYDETTGDYVPRYGPGSIKKSQDKVVPYIEVKEGEDPMQDPF